MCTNKTGCGCGCDENKKFQQLSVKGDPGDSSGYIGVAPEPGRPATWRYRLPFKWTFVTASTNGIQPSGVKFRTAPTAGQLQQAAWSDLSFTGTKTVMPNHTIEVKVDCGETEGAVHVFQIIKIA